MTIASSSGAETVSYTATIEGWCSCAPLARLLAEPLDERRVGAEVGVEDLDRDASVQHRVGRRPHLRHATGPDQFVEPVATSDEIAQ